MLYYPLVTVMDNFKVKKIAVKNFKSLSNFEISDLTDFICLIGVNGSGKTTVLQLLGFIKALMNGNVKDWLASQDLTANELLTIGTEKKFSIEIRIEAVLNSTEVYWEGKFNTRELRCSSEIMQDDNAKYSYSSGKFITKISDETKSVDFSNLKYDGSIFSLYATKLGSQLKQLKLFGVLDPHAIASSTRQSSKNAPVDVEENGKNLCGFFANLPLDSQKKIFEDLQQFYPTLKKYEVKKQRFGWKTILLSELEKTAFNATSLSYGTLRLYLMLSQQYADCPLVLFDEVENGLNQELFDMFVKMLLGYKKHGKQVVVTTHSGLLLNYLPDEVAAESVLFLYKDRNNFTKAKKFFKIPALQEKLQIMGPGEAMGDTDLNALSESLRKED